MGLRSQNLQLALWAAGILLFGFGDTVTSLLVFQNGGREANALMGFALGILGSGVWSFLLLKLAATSAVLVIGGLVPRLEGAVSLAVLFAGLFLVVQNATVLVATSR